MPTITPFDMTGGSQALPNQVPHVEQAPVSNRLPSTEVPPPEAPVVAKNTEPSPEVRALMRRERQIRQRARQLEQEKQSFQAKQSEIEQNVHTQWKQKLA